VTLPSLSLGSVARANSLDTLAAVLAPADRDKLANLLTEDDIATLKHLVEQGLGANTLRAMTSDLAYIDAWARAATGEPPPWPAPQPLLLKFIAHHLWDPAKRADDAAHGMPEDVKAALMGDGLLRHGRPHAPATVRRRLALWSTLHRWRGLVGPFADPHVKTALKAAIRSQFRPVRRKSPRALTRDVIDQLVKTCWRGDLADLRDRAILLVGFASGGRRRSEIAHLRCEQIRKEEPTPIDPNDENSAKAPCYAIELGRTKTEDGIAAGTVLAVGRTAEALSAWLERASITTGPVFRSIDRWGTIGEGALTPEAVNVIVKRRCLLAGLDARLYSAHGLRSGYLTEAARQRVPLLEAMQQSRHKSVQQASVYYNEADRSRMQATRLAE